MASWVGRIRTAENECRDYLEPLVKARLYRDELPGEMDQNRNSIYQLDLTLGGTPSDIDTGNYNSPGSSDASPCERHVNAEIKGVFDSRDKAREFIEQMWDALPMPYDDDTTKTARRLYFEEEPVITRQHYNTADTQGNEVACWVVTAPLMCMISKVVTS